MKKDSDWWPVLVWIAFVAAALSFMIPSGVPRADVIAAPACDMTNPLARVTQRIGSGSLIPEPYCGDGDCQCVKMYLCERDGELRRLRGKIEPGPCAEPQM